MISFERSTPAEIVGAIRDEATRVYGSASYEDVAKALGVGRSAVSLWSSGVRRMSRPIRLLAERVYVELRTLKPEGGSDGTTR